MSKVEKEKTKVILFCGLSNAGKTTILNIFTKGDVFKTAPTLGISLSTLTAKDMNFRIFDLGGQEKFREEITPLLPFADLIIFVVDGSNREDLPEVTKEFKRILENSNKKLTPICVLRHKSDLKRAIRTNTLISQFGLKNTLDRQWAVLSTSAVSLEGLTDLYKWIVQQSTGEIPEFIVEQKREDELSFHYPCPMLKELDDGSTYCLNRDEFIETELTNFGFHEEVNKMVLKALPDLREEAEKNGKLICPDFCTVKNREKNLRCPVTNYKIETRGIRVTQDRYEKAVMLSQVYGQKIGLDICRECIYKIILSEDTILTVKEIRELTRSFT